MKSYTLIIRGADGSRGVGQYEFSVDQMTFDEQTSDYCIWHVAVLMEKLNETGSTKVSPRI